MLLSSVGAGGEVGKPAEGIAAKLAGKGAAPGEGGIELWFLVGRGFSVEG